MELRVQELLVHVCTGADVQLRKGARVVVLDVEDGELAAMELSGWDAGGRVAAEGVGAGFQLRYRRAGLCGERIARVLLSIDFWFSAIAIGEEGRRRRMWIYFGEYPVVFLRL